MATCAPTLWDTVSHLWSIYRGQKTPRTPRSAADQQTERKSFAGWVAEQHPDVHKDVAQLEANVGADVYLDVIKLSCAAVPNE